MKKQVIKPIIWVLYLFLFVGQTFAQTADAMAEIDAFITQQAERNNIPGIAVGVVKGDQLIWSKGYGWANLEKRQAMSPQGVMNIASISKTITATAILQLWEKGSLQLDVDVNTYLPFSLKHPKFPEKAITIRQLLTHTSGIKDGPGYKKGYACGDPAVSLKDWIESCLAVGGEHYYADYNFYPTGPEATHRYSNVAFGLLGYIVEQVTKQAFHLYVRDNILHPIGMTNTAYMLTEIDTNRIVIPYLYLGPLQQGLQATEDLPLPYFNPYCTYSFWNYPDGLIRTSIEDLSKYAAAYLNGGIYKGQRILKEETIDMMLTAQLGEALNEDQDQGLSWFHNPKLGPSWFHGGSDPGVSTRLYIDRSHKMSVIIFQNSNDGNPTLIAEKLFETFSKS